MKYKAIIFDMDGTIIDSEHIWHLATKQLLSNRNIELPDAALAEICTINIGASLPNSCGHLKKVFNLSDPLEHLIQEKSTHAVNFYRSQAKYMSGFADFHAHVKKAQLKVALATNATPDFMAMINETLNLHQFFDHHLYNVSHVNFIGKPDPAIYLHAARQIDVDPIHCIAIEDSAHGIRAAKNAGMFCIGINTSRSAAQVKEADMVINAYHEINLNALLI